MPILSQGVADANIGAPSNMFRALWDAGYKRLVPITVAGQPVSEHSTLYKRQAKAMGKAPGVRRDDGLWVSFDWLRHETTEADLERWHTMGAGVGIRTGGGLVAVDIDTLDEKLAKTCEELAVAHLGAAPVRVGRWPKRLLLYRTAEEPPYRRVLFDDGTDYKPGKEPRVELLTEGRQFVAAGVHPGTGKPYEWRPHVYFPSALSPVTGQQLDAYFAALAQRLPKADSHVETAGQRAKADQAQLAGDPDTIAAAVAALPNNHNFKDRESYIRVGAALKAALPGDDEGVGLDLFQEWAARWTEGENDPDVVAADWRRLKPPYSIGAQYLYNLAQRHGSFSVAQAWFGNGSGPAPADASVKPKLSFFDPVTAWRGKEVPAREWLVDGWILKGALNLVYGKGGVGKTLLMHQYAVCAAAGRPWLGKKTTRAKVMCFFCEDDEGELHRRQVDIMRATGISDDDIQGRLRFTTRVAENNVLGAPTRENGQTLIKATELCEQLRAAIEVERPDVVILDTLADIFGGSEIDRGQVTQFLSLLSRLTLPYGATLIALGHPSVAGESEGRSGSTGWANKARNRLYLTYADKKKEVGNVRRLTNTKTNHTAKGGELEIEWRRGAFVARTESQPVGIDLEAFKKDGGAALPDMKSANERAVVAALLEAEAAKVPLNNNPRSGTGYAPTKLKRFYPEHVGTLTIDDIDAAMIALEKRGAIQQTTFIGAHRSRVHGYNVNRTRLRLNTTPDAHSGVFA